MIDTDKYEGHAEGPWKIESYNQGQAFTGIKFNMTHREQTHLAMKMYGREKEREATANLIADAPLLLAEVKRLRESIKELAESWTVGKPSTLLVRAANELKKVIE